MEKRLTLDEYFRMPETNRPQELIYGVLREPPPPTYGHQLVVGRLFTLIDAHVREKDLGRVCLSPVAVVLDREADLMVEPDIIFIATERLTMVDDRVWGAPDLIVEVASPSTEHYDRTLKFAAYRRYGVRECWLVYQRDGRVDVIDCATETTTSFAGEVPIRSKVLPEFAVLASECFK
jgi:Uma2 family endonuclease